MYKTFGMCMHIMVGWQYMWFVITSKKIESKLLEINSQVAQVLESCNENAKSIQSLNSTILEFMRQFEYNLTSLGSPGLRRQPSTLGPYVVDVVDNTICLKGKARTWL